MSETYRGIPVPDDWGPVTDIDDWKAGVDAAMALLRPVVDALHDDSPCRLDHHGYCQEHGLPGPVPCPDGEARRLLKMTEEGSDQR